MGGVCFWASVFISRETIRDKRVKWLLEPRACESGKASMRGQFGAPGLTVRPREGTATQEAAFPAMQHMEGPRCKPFRVITSLVPEHLSPGQARSRSLTGAWWFRHRILFLCGIFASTFYSFKKSDNTGGERRLGPRTRIEFPIKIANYRNL